MQSKQKMRRGESFIRVRVKIDILLPLCKGRVITLESGEKTWVSFKQTFVIGVAA